MEGTTPGYYAIIPADVRYDDSIPAAAKLLYGEISALTNAEGFCFAGNSYFAGIYKCSEDSVSRWITELEKAGYIKRDIVRDKSGQITQRKLYISVSVTEEHPLGKIADTSPQNFREDTGKNAEDTNTSITDISLKENKKRKVKRVSLDDAQLKDFWITWIKSIAGESWMASDKNFLYSALMAFYEPRETKKQEPAKTETACSRLGKLLLQYSDGNPTTMCLMLDRATASGWKSVFPLNQGQMAQPKPPDTAPGGEYIEI